MTATKDNWKNLLGGHIPPNGHSVTNSYYASYNKWIHFNKAKYKTNTVLSILGKNTFLN